MITVMNIIFMIIPTFLFVLFAMTMLYTLHVLLNIPPKAKVKAIGINHERTYKTQKQK